MLRPIAKVARKAARSSAFSDTQVDPTRSRARAGAILRDDCTPLHTHPVLGLLRQTRHAWSVELTRAVLSVVHRHMRTWKDGYDYQLRSALMEDFGCRMPPAMLEEIAAAWPRDATSIERWHGVIERLLITLEFRRDMLSALR
jgi:hypothetical protein